MNSFLAQYMATAIKEIAWVPLILGCIILVLSIVAHGVICALKGPSAGGVWIVLALFGVLCIYIGIFSFGEDTLGGLCLISISLSVFADMFGSALYRLRTHQ